jgi:hypothetical protein
MDPKRFDALTKMLCSDARDGRRRPDNPFVGEVGGHAGTRPRAAVRWGSAMPVRSLERLIASPDANQVGESRARWSG